jgi:hypothetical protein
MTVGPIQLVVISFEGDVLESKVLDELEVAVATGDIRLIDFLVIEKDEKGNVWGSEVSVFTDDDEEGEAFGAMTYGLIDQDPEQIEEGVYPETWAIPEAHFVMEPGEINELAYQIPEGSSAIVVLFEHAWARRLHEATVQAGGLMLAQGMIDPNGLALFQSELEAIQEASAVVEAAQAVEAEAVLEAAEAVALSEAVKEAAARDAAQALVAAKMIEEAAIEDARQVMLAALTFENEGGSQ